MLNPTDRQLQALEEVCKSIDQRGLPPTMVELAETRGVTPTAVRHRLDGLVRKGRVRQVPRAARGMLPTDAGRRLFPPPAQDTTSE